MKIKRFNDINENFVDKNTSIEKFNSKQIDIHETSFFGDEYPDFSDSNLSATMQWYYQFDASMNGVDGIITSIISINLHGEILTYNEETDSDDSHDIDINFNDENCEFIVNDTVYIDNHEGGYNRQVLPYYPLGLEFDKDKETGKVTIRINFV